MDCGRIELFTGPMFSGKTTKLMKELRRLQREIGQPFILLKHASDCRYTLHEVTTHDGESFPATKTEKLRDVEEMICDKNFKIIG